MLEISWMYAKEKEKQLKVLFGDLKNKK